MSVDCRKPSLIRLYMEENLEVKHALEAFLSADRSDRPEMTLDEINEEIRKARQERKERLAHENAEMD